MCIDFLYKFCLKHNPYFSTNIDRTIELKVIERNSHIALMDKRRTDARCLRLCHIPDHFPNSYGLHGPGIESWWGRDLTHLFRPVLEPTKPTVQWVPGLSRGKERPGRDADPSPPSSAVGHERVDLYLYSPYGPYGLYRASVPVQG
jgi:hypothetical protein